MSCCPSCISKPETVKPIDQVSKDVEKMKKDMNDLEGTLNSTLADVHSEIKSLSNNLDETITIFQYEMSNVDANEASDTRQQVLESAKRLEELISEHKRYMERTNSQISEMQEAIASINTQSQLSLIKIDEMEISKASPENNTELDEPSQPISLVINERRPSWVQQVIQAAFSTGET